MNIAFVSDYSYPWTKGGVETRYYTLARYLINQGHLVTWFTSKQWEGASECEVDGIRLIGICPSYQAFTSEGKRKKSQALLFGLASLKLLFMPDRFDVIDLSQYPFFHCFPGKIYSFLRKAPIVVSWYEFWGDHWLEYLGTLGKVGQWMERLVARLADNIIVVSQQSLDSLIAVGCKPSAIHFVPNWIDCEHIAGVNAIGLPYDVCYFGRLKGHKNVGSLLKAIAFCRDEGLILRTRIIGEGPERHTLEKLAKELVLGSQVEFMGRIEGYDELLGHVKSSQLYVNPSTKEGGGSIASLEAYACGVPVVAVRHPLGLDETLVIEGRTGYWATDASPESLAGKLSEHFRKDGKDRQKMRRAAIEWATQFSASKLCRQIEEIYTGLMQAGNNSQGGSLRL